MQSGFYLRIPPRFVLVAWCALRRTAAREASAVALEISGGELSPRTRAPRFRWTQSPRTRATRIKPRVERSAESRGAGEARSGTLGIVVEKNGTRGAGDRVPALGTSSQASVAASGHVERPLRRLVSLVWYSQGSAHHFLKWCAPPWAIFGRPRCGLGVSPPSGGAGYERSWRSIEFPASPRLEIPAGSYASSSEGILHPLSERTPAEMLGLRKADFTLSKKLSDTFVFLKSESRNDPMGASGQARHPLTRLIAPISRGRYV
jgi:hypothetical protein